MRLTVPTSWYFLAIFSILAPLPRPQARENPPTRTLDREIENIIQARDFRHSRWGILVVEADGGNVVYERNADQLFAPASVTKVYSSAAAHIALGPDHRFETPVHRRGNVRDGVLQGDLILVAQGDPTLGGRNSGTGSQSFANNDHIYSSPEKLDTGRTPGDPLAGLRDLARQVRESGIRKVTGEVLIDTRLFDPALGSGSGPTLLTPIMINDNLVDVVVRPGSKPGDPATHEILPRNDFIQVDVRVETAVPGGITSITPQRVGPQRHVIRGTIAADAPPQVRICVVDDPQAFARALFIDALRAEGVEVSASGLRTPSVELPLWGSYSRLPRVAMYRSPPFSEALKIVMKVSHNLHASILPLLLAVKQGQRTLEDGMKIQAKILTGLGLPLDGISLETGAGGGNGDRVSPRATVRLLQALRRREDWPAFEATFPILGVDGTLHDSVGPTSPARGKVKGKTGTYTDRNLLAGRTHLRAKALAGVMTTARGKPLILAIFVNDVPLPPGVTGTREGKVIGRLCEVLYQHAP